MTRVAVAGATLMETLRSSSRSCDGSFNLVESPLIKRGYYSLVNHLHSCADRETADGYCSMVLTYPPWMWSPSESLRHRGLTLSPPWLCRLAAMERLVTSAH